MPIGLNDRTMAYTVMTRQTLTVSSSSHSVHYVQLECGPMPNVMAALKKI